MISNLTGASAFGIFLRQPSTFGTDRKLTIEDSQKIIEDLVDVLVEAALIAKVQPRRGSDAYQRISLFISLFAICSSNGGNV